MRLFVVYECNTQFSNPKRRTNLDIVAREVSHLSAISYALREETSDRFPLMKSAILFSELDNLSYVDRIASITLTLLFIVLQSKIQRVSYCID